MREIKFRALAEHLETGVRKWFYYGVGTKPALVGYKWVSDDLQFVNLPDKSDREIYEGDIVKGLNGDIGQSPVFWDEYTLSYQPFTYLNNFKGANFEVIGNIYENPELLK